MLCQLCGQPIALWELDSEGVAGMPTHDYCGDAYRAELAELLAQVEAMILAEPNPRRHRHHVVPPAA